MKTKNVLEYILTSVLFFLLTGCSLTSTNPTLSLPADANEKIAQIVNMMDDYGQFSGAVLISVKGKIIYKDAVGFANIADSIPITCDTKFRIASFTKPITDMLILQLVEDGKLKLDDKLTDYIPEFPKEKGVGITIHHLLTHTAGITGESRIPNLIDIEKEYYTRERFLDCIIEKDIIFKPGEGREYSNFGYALLGMIIEKASGKSYEELLQEKICRPAGMKNTMGDITAQHIDKRALGYNYNYFDGLELASFIDMSFTFGAGHLLSTVNDLYLFDQALYTNKLLNEKSKELFLNKYGWKHQNCPYGKGFKKIRSNSLDGSVNGFGSHTQRIEKDSVFIVALRNTKEYKKEIVIKWPRYMMSRILAVMYGAEYDLPKKSGAFAIFQTLIESGYEAAEKLQKEIIGKQNDKYYLRKREFIFFKDELNDKGMNDLTSLYDEIYTKLN